MDALDDFLDSLAGLGTASDRGCFTVARSEIWSRLRSSLHFGEGAPRHFLRWLHARQAESIRIDAQRDRLTITASLDEALPHDTLDYSGHDIDLARALVGAEMLNLSSVTLELDDGVTRKATSTGLGSWTELVSLGRKEVVLRLTGCSTLVPRWAEEIARAFRHSTTAVFWNQTLLSGPYRFAFPVLAWRQLRRRTALNQPPLVLDSPREALESFQAVRFEKTDVALALGYAQLSSPAFELLRFGELLPLSGTSVRALSGLGGVLRSEQFPTDIGGDVVSEGPEMVAILTSLRDEAVDMALQLYHRGPLTPEQADASFFGLQSVLLHLLDSQRFTEGHLLAEWIGPSLEKGKLLSNFRYGFTFDRLRSLLAEPAGHPQTAFRWHRQAEARLREESGRDRASAEEALLINARLELRARSDNPRGLSGDLHGRLLQLANQLRGRGHYERAASVFLLLAHSFRPTAPERLEHLLEASRCCLQPPYTDALAQERQARGEGSPGP